MAIGGHRKTTAHSGDGWLAPVGPGTRRLASTADVAALREGYITVTPLQFDLTHHATLKQWTQRAWSAKG